MEDLFPGQRSLVAEDQQEVAPPSLTLPNGELNSHQAHYVYCTMHTRERTESEDTENQRSAKTFTGTLGHFFIYFLTICHFWTLKIFKLTFILINVYVQKDRYECIDIDI